MDTLFFVLGFLNEYGDRNTFRLANARHKAEIVADLLKESGCRGVNLSLADSGYVPAIFEVIFEPSENVSRN